MFVLFNRNITIHTQTVMMQLKKHITKAINNNYL